MKEQLHHLAVQPRAIHGGPLLERGAIAHRDVEQEVTAITRGRLREAAHAERTPLKMRMRMSSAGTEQLRERDQIDTMVAGRVEVQRLARGHERRKNRRAVAQHLAQGRERLAQTIAGNMGSVVGPEKLGQNLTLVRTSGFDDEIGQQGATFGREHGGNRGAVDGDLEGAQQGNREMWHTTTSCLTFPDDSNVGDSRQYSSIGVLLRCFCDGG